MTGKTLKELNVQVGDVVRREGWPDGDTACVGHIYDIVDSSVHGLSGKNRNSGSFTTLDGTGYFSIISRATKYTDWKFGIAPDGADTHVMPDGSVAWRVKVEPEVEMVSAYYRMDWTGEMVIDQHDNCGENGIHCITFTTIGGVPDCASVKMEVL